DDKRIMRFALKKDKVLVLRGKGAVWFQTSNPAAISFKVGSQPETLVSESAATFEHQGNSTLAWPAEAREIIAENFAVGAKLPFTEGPAEEESTPTVE